MADEILVHPFAGRLEFLILAKPENAAYTISVVINGGRHYLAYSLTISCHRICKIFFLSGRNLGEMSVDGIHRLVGKHHFSKVRDIITIVTESAQMLRYFNTTQIGHTIPKLSPMLGTNHPEVLAGADGTKSVVVQSKAGYCSNCSPG